MKRLILFALVACTTNETTPAGPVGKPTNLRARLVDAAAAARAPTDDQATRHELDVDLHGVKAKLVWRTFEDGSGKYIASAGWDVVTPAKGVTLEPLGVLNPVNAGSPSAPVQAEIVRVRWRAQSGCGKEMGERSIRIDASGTAAEI